MSAREVVTETLRLAVGALAQAAPDWVVRELPASFVEVYARSRADDRRSAAERAAAVRQVGQDGLWLLERLEATAPAALRQREASAVLRTVWDQRYERVAGRVQVREQTLDCTPLIVTPHDPGGGPARSGARSGRGTRCT